MNFLPDWLPNVHPLIVHFPIAILCTAVFLDVAALLKSSSRFLAEFPLVLYVLGSVSAIIAFFTGRHASDLVDIPTRAILAVNEHSDAALYTMLAFGIYTLVRMVVTLRLRSESKPLRIFMVLLPLAGLLMLAKTAEHGARLVYEFGIGVGSAAESMPAENSTGDIMDHDHAGDHEVATVQISRQENGSWNWRPGAGASSVIEQDFGFLTGSLADLEIVVSDTGATLVSGGVPVFFATNDSLANIEANAEFDISEFSGQITLAHNITSPDTYDFVRVGSGQLVHGRMQKGVETTFGTAKVVNSGIVKLRSVSAGTHFRAYQNGNLSAHGHGPAAPPGGLGLIIDGSGPVRLISLGVTTLE